MLLTHRDDVADHCRLPEKKMAAEVAAIVERMSFN